MLAGVCVWSVAAGVAMAQPAGAPNQPSVPAEGSSAATALAGPTTAPPTCLIRGTHARIELAGGSAPGDWAELYFYAPGSSKSPAWYRAKAARTNGGWRAVLPRPSTTDRVHYVLVVRDRRHRLRLRRPSRGAYIADVVGQPCTAGTAPTQAEAAISLTVPNGHPRVPPGFAGDNIAEYLAPAPAPRRAPIKKVSPRSATKRRAAAPRVSLHPGGQVRITTRSGKRTAGVVNGADASGVRLGSQPAVDWSDITLVERYEAPDAGRRVLGALAGLGGGFALAIVYYVASESADSKAPLYLGTFGGAALGALVVSGRWRTVAAPKPSARARAKNPATWLARRAYVVPQRGGARVGLGLTF